ncbi:hypothetical protein [Mycoplasma simbae]|uniref:hypothetical protein n=1 Tax=Mycoplasma simbae TaxID=36744 RepID=UPI00049798A4|nr:hypothetical protein [Mycoplasma simbae]
MNVDLIFILLSAWSLYSFTTGLIVISTIVIVSRKIKNNSFLGLYITLPKNIFKNVNNGIRYPDMIFTYFIKKISFLLKITAILFALHILLLIATLLLGVFIFSGFTGDFFKESARDIRDIFYVFGFILLILFFIYLCVVFLKMLISYALSKKNIIAAQELNKFTNSDNIQSENFDFSDLKLEDYFIDNLLQMSIEVHDPILKLWHRKRITLDSSYLTNFISENDYETFEINLHVLLLASNGILKKDDKLITTREISFVWSMRKEIFAQLNN